MREVIGTIVGHRAWKVRLSPKKGDYLLTGTAAKSYWAPRRMNHAVHGPDSRSAFPFPNGHSAPEEGCLCGFNAYYQASALFGSNIGYEVAKGWVFGAGVEEPFFWHRGVSGIELLGSLQASGKVIKQELGFRAEYAYPLVLWGVRIRGFSFPLTGYILDVRFEEGLTLGALLWKIARLYRIKIEDHFPEGEVKLPFELPQDGIVSVDEARRLVEGGL